MSDQHESATEIEFPVNVNALLRGQRDEFTEALKRAIAAYIAAGGSPVEYVYAMVTITDTDNIGTAITSQFDLEDYKATSANITFERDGGEPVDVKINDQMTLRDILAEAGIELADGETVFDNSDDIVDLNEDIDPIDGDQTLTIRAPAPD